jgi:ElaB/YqjD/DUF883 family membrane-anchored ribosome-binding protein
MTTTSDAYRKAANSDTVRRAREAARDFGEDASEIASDVARKAGKQYARAEDVARDLYDEAHEVSKDYPHITLALAVGVGFLLGVFVAGRR